MPIMNPAEIWQQSGRWDAIGEELFRLKDRKGADMALGVDPRGSRHLASLA